LNILKVKIEGRKDEPFYGLHKELYAKKLPENATPDVLMEELLEIRKRYPKIHRIEFTIEAIDEPVPFKGEIDPKLVREAEEEARKRKE